MNQLDVNEARKRLVDALGETSKLYFAHLKSWFCMRSDRDEFDRLVRTLLPEDKVYLHNEFIFAIVTKCQSLCEPNSYVYSGTPKQRQPLPITTTPSGDGAGRMQTNGNIVIRKHSAVEIKPLTVARTVKPKNKPAKVNFDNRFQPVDPVSLLPIPSPSLLDNKSQHVRYCSRDHTLPDNGLVHGRMLLAAWDAGLERGCEDKAITLILAATEQFLKRLIVAVVTNRKGYRLREGKVIHSVGQPTLNPWLHSSWAVHDRTSNSYATDICPSSRPPHVPSIPVLTQKAERDSAFYLACSTEQEKPSKPISVLDVFQTLQVKKSVIPSHTVLAVNLERISQRLYHPD